jgi:hypothetical protein
MRFGLKILAIAAGAMLCGGQALAGGDDYDPTNDKEGKGPVYFGFVRDTRGSAVAEARVVLRPKTGEPVIVKATALGLYRSHISAEVRPDDVEVLCEKDGYKQVRVIRRNQAGTMNIETSCTLQRL